MGKIKAKNIIMGIVVFALAVGLVLNYLSLNKVSRDLRNANKEYEQLVNEEKTLNYEITKQVSFSNIEQLAGDRLGMVKVEPYQIQYINFNEEDSITAASLEEDNNGLVDNLVASFNILVEYLK